MKAMHPRGRIPHGSSESKSHCQERPAHPHSVLRTRVYLFRIKNKISVQTFGVPANADTHWPMPPKVRWSTYNGQAMPLEKFCWAELNLYLQLEAQKGISVSEVGTLSIAVSNSVAYSALHLCRLAWFALFLWPYNLLSAHKASYQVTENTNFYISNLID